MTEPLPRGEGSAADGSLVPQSSPRHPYPVYCLKQLLGESREARILHDGNEYRLLLTRNNKVMLVK